MSSILEQIDGGEVRHFNAGEVVIEQGQRTNLLFFLIEGTVEVVKDGTQVAKASQPGAVFGELSALLGGNHTATVRTLEPCAFHVVQNPRKYLVDVKQQFEGHEHLGMVDNVLETLMHRHPVNRVKAGESKVRQTESSD